MLELEDKPERHLDPNVIYTVSAFEWSNLVFRFPENVQGLKTLEIGAGQSDLTTTLREHGAVAFAVDPAYEYPNELDQATEEYLQKEVLPESKDWCEGLQRARSRFKRDFKQHPEFYKTAKSILLPFSDNTFDIVFSQFCICPIVSKNYIDLEQSVREILRVLKPLGIAEIYPFDNTDDIFQKKIAEAKKHEANLEGVLRFLDSTPHVYQGIGITYPHEARKALKTRTLLRVQKSVWRVYTPGVF